MPQETIETENQSQEDSSNSAKAGDNSGDDGVQIDQELALSGDPIESAGLVSTTEFSAPVKDDASKDDKTDTDDSKSADGKDKDAETDEEKEAREAKEKEDAGKLDKTFQDSDRFKELNKQKNDAVQGKLQADANLDALKNQVETLTELVKGLGGSKKTAEPGYQDVLQMTDEAIIEGFESDPKGFLANFGKQVAAEVEGRVTQANKVNQAAATKTSQEDAINKLYADYEKDNPDFVEMWEAGEIQTYIENNPGNTPISAHQVIKATKSQDTLKAGQDEAIKTAVQEAVDKATKNFKAKKSSKVLAAGPGGGSQAVTTGTPAELANTKGHGGLTKVLTDRSLAREKAANA